MSFVVYNVSTKHVYDRYDTEKGALIGMTATKKRIVRLAERSVAKGYSSQRRLDEAKKEVAEIFVASRADFDTKIDGIVTVKNLLSGMPVQIRESDRGGCCDPSTERYHAM